MLAKLDPDLAKLWPTSAEFAEALPNLGEHLSKLAHFAQKAVRQRERGAAQRRRGDEPHADRRPGDLYELRRRLRALGRAGGGSALGVPAVLGPQPSRRVAGQLPARGPMLWVASAGGSWSRARLSSHQATAQQSVCVCVCGCWRSRPQIDPGSIPGDPSSTSDRPQIGAPHIDRRWTRIDLGAPHRPRIGRGGEAREPRHGRERLKPDRATASLVHSWPPPT